MPLSGDPYAISRALRAGARTYEDAEKIGKLVKKELRRVTSQAGTGRVYTTYFFTDSAGKVHPIGVRPPHQASAPGQPPAIDTGTLNTSFEYDVSRVRGGARVEVGCTADYAVHLEFGTKNMRARPFFRGTVFRLRPGIREIVAQGVARRQRVAARTSGGRG
jgi:HK97 gp10 family phage protein